MKKIVMIDDNGELLKSISNALKDAIIVEKCYGATEAIVAIMMNQPDVILLDDELSEKGGDGLKVVEWLKKNNVAVKIFSTTKNTDARKEYEKMGISWVDKSDLVALRALIIKEGKDSTTA